MASSMVQPSPKNRGARSPGQVLQRRDVAGTYLWSSHSLACASLQKLYDTGPSFSVKRMPSMGWQHHQQNGGLGAGRLRNSLGIMTILSNKSSSSCCPGQEMGWRA